MSTNTKTKLKLKLVELEIRQKDFAEKLGVTRQSLNGWATNKNNPSLEMALKIAKILDCKVDDLWELKDEE